MVISSRKCWLAVLGVAVASQMLVSGFNAAAQTSKDSKKDEKKDESVEPPKTVRQRFMEGKLVISQELLQGIVLSDYKLIERSATGMNLLTLGEEWGFNNSEEYARMSEDLRRISRQLIKAAREKNGDAATLAYQRMTLNCVECHKALREGFK